MAGQDGYILAVDLGTSGPKVALVSMTGEVVDWHVESIPLTLLPDGGAEQDPAEWWRAVTLASRHLMGRGAVDPQAVVAVAVTTQWSGTVAIDRSGRVLHPAIIWMDSRGAPYVEAITSGPIRLEGYGVGRLARWIRTSGGAPGHAGKDSIAHILWLKHERPSVYSEAWRFLEPKDYLNYLLTGRAVAGFDSITLHWVTDNRDPAAVHYDARLLELATVDPSKLPELRPPGYVLGPILPDAAGQLGVTDAARVVIGTPDLHSAAVGSGAVADYAAHLYLGTSSWLTCHVPFKKTDLLHNMASLPSAIPGRYFVANEQETAGACLTYLADNLLFYPDDLDGRSGTESVYAAFDRVAARVPAGAGGVIFTPWLYGERTPVDDRTVRGGFFNQSLETTREDLIRAVFEGVAYNSRWLLTYVEKFVKRRIDTITMVGGGARSEVWCRIHADVLGRTVRRVAEPILANARGVALLAAASLGELDYADIPGLVEIDRTFQPDPATRDLHDRRFREYVNLYKATRPIYARLNATP